MQKNLSVEHLMSETRRFPPQQTFQDQALLSRQEDYESLYKRSIDDPDGFWLDQAGSLTWFRTPTRGRQYKWDTHQRLIEHTWFEDGTLNASVNCLDRHILSGQGDRTAIIWQGDEDEEQTTLSYQALYNAVCRLSNALKARGIGKGDRVCLYLPMIPELAIAVLACARIGAIHSVVFAGFSAESLSHRLNDASCRLVITANEGKRGGKDIPLKSIVDDALMHSPSIEKVIVVKRTDKQVNMEEGRDVWYHEEVAYASPVCPAEVLEAEHPLFILYTSGSTGKPKGVVHTLGGYLLYTATTHRYLFDLKKDDIYWCTADIGWITGHSYVVYGPLANGSTVLMFEGTPTYPDHHRVWQIIDKYQVTLFYTAPTLIRTLIQNGADHPLRHQLKSLRLLGTVGEPINPEAWMWYHEIVGKGKCPIVDTWWQTETGGILLSALPGVHTLKPGSANRPFFGVEPVIVREDGSPCKANEGGCLCLKTPHPGMMRTTWGDHERFIDTYFTQFANMYFTGDGCYVDEDGDYWLMGRIDDVVNVSGHRISTAEVESALVSHHAVAEAAVVAVPDAIKGQSLFAYVTLVTGTAASAEIKKEIFAHIKQEIGAIAVPDTIQFTNYLPKTRSGKIMRRILRKIASKELHDLGDISTLADPHLVEKLMEGA